MSADEALEKPSRLAIFRNRNFRFLWAGSAVSAFGDQFYLIALPWLVLVITGDNALALGSIMAAAAVPRAIFMVFGGAVADRISPRIILIVSAAMRALLVGLLALLVLTNMVELWMLFALSLAFGFADAFAAPASMALLPRIVEEDHLPPANALMQGTWQISGIMGPAAAGILIAFFGSDMAGTSAAANLRGVGMAFVVDASTFLVSMATMWMLRLPNGAMAQDAAKGAVSFLRSIWEGFQFVMARPAFRAMMILIAILSFFANGPMVIGLPMLAKTVFAEGAFGFGLLMSAFAGGALVGAAAGGILPRPRPQIFGTVVFVCACLGTLGIVGTALSPDIITAAIAAAVGSVFNGYANILFISWFQSRTPTELLGRVMSLIMTASLGLAPISMALAGALIVYDVRLVMAISAGISALFCLVALLIPSIRQMDVAESEASAARSS